MIFVATVGADSFCTSFVDLVMFYGTELRIYSLLYEESVSLLSVK